MRLVLLGAPGAGKGTSAAFIQEKLGIPHISTGDIFRANVKNGTELGNEVKAFIDKGLLVPDRLTVSIVRERLKEPDCVRGFILDGFPRNISQARQLDGLLLEMGVSIDHVVNIEVADEEVVRRISSRRLCPVCGASYNIVSKPPAAAGICDLCGNGIVQRVDDSEDTVKSRLEVYHRQTKPLIRYYESTGRLLPVDGSGSIKVSAEKILKALGVFDDPC